MLTEWHLLSLLDKRILDTKGISLDILHCWNITFGIARWTALCLSQVSWNTVQVCPWPWRSWLVCSGPVRSSSRSRSRTHACWRGCPMGLNIIQMYISRWGPSRSCRCCSSATFMMGYWTLAGGITWAPPLVRETPSPKGCPTPSQNQRTGSCWGYNAEARISWDWGSLRRSWSSAEQWLSVWQSSSLYFAGSVRRGQQGGSRRVGIDQVVLFLQLWLPFGGWWSSPYLLWPPTKALEWIFKPSKRDPTELGGYLQYSWPHYRIVLLPPT